MTKYIANLFVLLLLGCGSSDDKPVPAPPPDPIPQTVTEVPINEIERAYFRDIDRDSNSIGGELVVIHNNNAETPKNAAQSLWVYWADVNGQKIGEPLLKTKSISLYNIEIPSGTPIENNSNAVIIYPYNPIGLANVGTIVRFHDFTGNAQLSGPGGNYDSPWYYGQDRSYISIHRDAEQGICVFDNGLATVVDMKNTIDNDWKYRTDLYAKNTVNNNLYPPYTFQCEESPVNTHRKIADDFGVWTYSTMNDAMFYGTVVYDAFLKHLGEPPLQEKIRLRVHYGSLSQFKAYWDGAYANFSDGYPFQYSMSSLDAIAHEVAHGVLSRISELKFELDDLSLDARTAHEAFADISAVMAKYELTGHTNNWLHGEESMVYEGSEFQRSLNKIKTEPDAIASFFEYESVGDNYYQRIGMLTYPFYLLSQKWGLELTYQLYLDAAKNCWTPDMTLIEGAFCIKNQAETLGLNQLDVINAFKAVKIKLFNDGVLSHFYMQKHGLNAEFNDDSRSTSSVLSWLWEFGDGTTSSLQNPFHTYNEAGTYNVKLIVTDTSGDTDSFTRVVTANHE